MDPISWKVLMSLNFSVSITNIASWALVRAMLSDLMFNFSYNTTPPPSGEKVVLQHDRYLLASQ